MALNLDGMIVLRAIGANPVAFSFVVTDADKYARQLVMKQLKKKGAGLENFQAVRKALGSESFALVVDGLSDAEVKSFVGRFDKYHPEFKTSDASWRRRHLRDLVDGKIEAATKPLAKPKGKPLSKARAQSRKKASEPAFLDLQSMRTTRKR